VSSLLDKTRPNRTHYSFPEHTLCAAARYTHLPMCSIDGRYLKQRYIYMKETTPQYLWHVLAEARHTAAALTALSRAGLRCHNQFNMEKVR